MRIGDFPIEHMLEHKLSRTDSIHDMIDESCPQGELFSHTTSMDPKMSDSVNRYAKSFFNEHVDPTTPHRSSLVAEPFHFSVHIAKLLQHGDVTVKIPDTGRLNITAGLSETIDDKMLYELYLRQNYHLDSLIRTYMDRISGVDMLDEPILEPSEVQHARLLAGVTFLLIDIVNAHSFHDEQAARDKHLLEAFEAQFNTNS